MNRVIGIAGEAGAGKDSFAQVLIDSGRYTRLNFADHLKNICSQVFGLSQFQMNTPIGKEQKFAEPLLLYKPQLLQVVDIIKQTHDITNFNYELNELFTKHGHPNNAKKLHSPREVLQFVGTDICRLAHRDYFVQVWLKQVAANPNTNFVCTDPRFLNEREAIRTCVNSMLIRIIRDTRQFSDSTYKHASETNMGDNSEYDVVILNDGSLEDLQNKAKRYL